MYKLSRNPFLSRAGFDYEDNIYQYAFEVDPVLLSKLEGVMLALKYMSFDSQNLQNSQEEQNLQNS
jgi:hypothetical protein